MIMKPCLQCGKPSPATRCPSCQAERQRERDAVDPRRVRGRYDSRWAALSRRARKAQPFCGEPGCGHPGSPENPLTCHHLTWPATKLAHVEVLCLRHNVARGPTPRGGNPGSGSLTPAFRVTARYFPPARGGAA